MAEDRHAISRYSRKRRFLEVTQLKNRFGCRSLLLKSNSVPPRFLTIINHPSPWRQIINIIHAPSISMRRCPFPLPCLRLTRTRDNPHKRLMPCQTHFGPRGRWPDGQNDLMQVGFKFGQEVRQVHCRSAACTDNLKVMYYNFSPRIVVFGKFTAKQKHISKDRIWFLKTVFHLAEW